MGVPQRALLSLPYGLMIGRSSIPSAGVGVVNHGPVVSPGMHFGPYEGEVATRENAMASDFSWEVSSDINVSYRGYCYMCGFHLENILIFCRFTKEKMSMSTLMLPENHTQTG